MLNSSRESLKYSYQREIDKIIEEILVNPRSLLTKSSKVFIDKYLKRELENLKNEILDTCDTLTGELANMTISAFIAGQKTDLENCISELRDVAPQLADKLQTIVNYEYESELGYTFVVHRHGKRVPSIDPTSKKAKKILHMWKTIIDELISIYHPGYEYVTGLDFDPTLNASYTHGCDVGAGIGVKDHICINPVNVKSLKTAEMGTYLFFKACHEVTHINREYHNENFLIEFESMLNQLAENPKKWYSLFNKSAEECKELLKVDGV
jgi:DNA repair ATPase RecN